MNKLKTGHVLLLATFVALIVSFGVTTFTGQVTGSQSASAMKYAKPVCDVIDIQSNLTILAAVNPGIRGADFNRSITASQACSSMNPSYRCVGTFSELKTHNRIQSPVYQRIPDRPWYSLTNNPSYVTIGVDINTVETFEKDDCNSVLGGPAIYDSSDVDNPALIGPQYYRSIKTYNKALCCKLE